MQKMFGLVALLAIAAVPGGQFQMSHKEAEEEEVSLLASPTLDDKNTSRMEIELNTMMPAKLGSGDTETEEDWTTPPPQDNDERLISIKDVFVHSLDAVSEGIKGISIIHEWLKAEEEEGDEDFSPTTTMSSWLDDDEQGRRDLNENVRMLEEGVSKEVIIKDGNIRKIKIKKKKIDLTPINEVRKEWETTTETLVEETTTTTVEDIEENYFQPEDYNDGENGLIDTTDLAITQPTDMTVTDKTSTTSATTQWTVAVNQEEEDEKVTEQITEANEEFSDTSTDGVQTSITSGAAKTLHDTLEIINEIVDEVIKQIGDDDSVPQSGEDYVENEKPTKNEHMVEDEMNSLQDEDGRALNKNDIIKAIETEVSATNDVDMDLKKLIEQHTAGDDDDDDAKQSFAAILNADNVLALQIASGGFCVSAVLLLIAVVVYRKRRNKTRIFKVDDDDAEK